MITIDGVKYRNLQEQVLENKNDIARIIAGNVVLGELGIKVVGQATSIDDLPVPENYTGEYGDAFLIGTQTPYDYYIFTRPFEGQTHPQWFNLGEFPVAGPTGEPGIGLAPTITIGSVQDGDTAAVLMTGTATNPVLNFTLPRGRTGTPGNDGISCTHQWVGTTLYITSASGTSSANLVGPEGPQALPVKIVGELSTVDALPQPPTEAIRQNAYIVDINGVKNLFVIVGEPGGILTWTKVGPMAGSAGTEITVNGMVVSSWSADDKLDKVYDGGPSLYGIDSSGYQIQVPYSSTPQGLGIVQRDSSGRIRVGTPIYDNNATTKEYVDDAITAIKTEILQSIYPIGSFYMNDTTSTSPETILGFGRWDQLNATFIMSTGTIPTSGRWVGPGEDGGSYDAIVVEHNHTLNLLADPSGSTYGGLARDLYSSAETYTNSAIVQSTGESGIEANIPRYHSAYIWRRIA